jgi:hypothetical protein
VSHTLVGPPPLVDASDRGKETTVKPLDSGMLSLVENALAGEGIPDDADTHLFGRHGRSLDLT